MAVTISPRDPEARSYRGELCLSVGCYKEAIEDLTIAIHEGWDGQAELMMRSEANLRMAQDPRMAISDAEAAARVIGAPERQSDAHLLLARIYAAWPDASVRDGKLALEHAGYASGLLKEMTVAAMLCTAMAYAEYGDFASAVKWQTKAGDAEKDEIRKMWHLRLLRLYKSKTPYRECQGLPF